MILSLVLLALMQQGQAVGCEAACWSASVPKHLSINAYKGPDGWHDTVPYGEVAIANSRINDALELCVSHKWAGYVTWRSTLGREVDSCKFMRKAGPSEGGGAGDWGGQAFPAKPSKPEPMDVPAIEVSAPSEIVWQSGPFDIPSCTNGGHIVEGNGLIACEGGKRKTCADKRRILLTAENGEKHCVLFQGAEETK